MRQVFNHWLHATRRKRSLTEREEELNRAVLSQAYDKWRDKFLENNLRPAVRIYQSIEPFLISHLCPRNSGARCPSAITDQSPFQDVSTVGGENPSMCP